MTATIRIFSEVLSNEALNESTTVQAKEIVERAEKTVQSYIAEMSALPAGNRPGASGVVNPSPGPDDGMKG